MLKGYWNMWLASRLHNRKYLSKEHCKNYDSVFYHFYNNRINNLLHPTSLTTCLPKHVSHEQSDLSKRPLFNWTYFWVCCFIHKNVVGAEHDQDWPSWVNLIVCEYLIAIWKTWNIWIYSKYLTLKYFKYYQYSNSKNLKLITWSFLKLDWYLTNLIFGIFEGIKVYLVILLVQIVSILILFFLNSKFL